MNISSTQSRKPNITLSENGLLPEAPLEKAVGSFNAIPVKQVQPSPVKPLSKLASLLDIKGIQQHVFSFFFRDLNASKERDLTQEDQPLRDLKEKYPKLPATIREWKKLSPEQRAEFENNLPPGLLEPVKGRAIASTILEKIDSLQATAILDASNAEHRTDRQPYFLAKKLQLRADDVSRTTREIERAVKNIIKLSILKGDCLRDGDKATQAGIKDKFQEAAEKAEEAMQQFQEFAQITTEPMNQADHAKARECLKKGLILKDKAFCKQAEALRNEYRDRITRIEAELNIAPEDSRIHTEFTDLTQAWNRIFRLEARFRDAFEARASGQEKEAEAYEQAAECALQVAKAYETGTPESLKNIVNLYSLKNLIFQAVGTIERYPLSRPEVANDPARAARCKKAANFINDQIEKFGWIEEGRKERFEKVFSKASEIAEPSADSCIVM